MKISIFYKRWTCSLSFRIVRKTFKKLKSNEINEVHSMELAQLVLKDAYDISEEVFPQLRKNLRLH
jgi:hypothetical protein